MRMTAVFLGALMLIMLIPMKSITTANENEPVLIWEMTDEDVISFVSDPQGHKFLRPAYNDGRPVYTVGDDGGLHMSNRNADWQSVDIKDDWMEAGQVYTIVAEYSSDEPALFRFMNTDSPYATLVISGEPDTHALLVYVTGITEGQRGVRLTTPQGVHVDYCIINISIYEGNVSGEIETTSWYMDVPSLSQLFSDYFYIGNIMEPGVIDDFSTEEMFLHHYNSVTSENSMKPVHVAPSRGQWNLSGPDRLVDWAEENNIRFHGHTLVWHSQSAPWLTEDDNGNPLTRFDARENMEYFISYYVGHYAGRIAAWDVVNEAFTDGVSDNASGSEWKKHLRSNSSWYKAYRNGINEDAGECPSDYIYDAFVFTRLADPGAILYYNDFNEESPGKREVIASMTEELNERWKDDPRNDNPNRLLIEGLGMQAHYWTNWLDPNDVRDTIIRFSQTGARVAITELDIPLGQWNSFGERDENNLENQALLYGELFEIFVQLSEYIDSVTLWGRADHQSWRAQGFPLLFDGKLEPKPAFWAIVEVIDPEQARIGRLKQAGETVDEEPQEPNNPEDEPKEDNIEDAAPTPLPPDNAPQPDDTPNITSSNNIPPWWAITLMGAGTATIIIALYILLKKK
ncbi:MAG: endo-1,4-beta-xylanase [Oscillospiraceae bacterium]|jgi:GH35 family endo-1,4-beta-xylanase|nr:endo-1,4-beta-xylanase [Oscillospiraceae bacterium]